MRRRIDKLNIDVINTALLENEGAYAHLSGAVFTGPVEFGNPIAAWLRIDEREGIRIGHNVTTKVQIDPSGDATFAGEITAASGTVGGWTIGATSLTGGSATLHSTGYLLLGTGNDVARVDATDATYRLWIGNATAGSAPFRVSKAGAVTAVSGTVGGWTLDTAELVGPSGSALRSGQTAFDTGTGFFLGNVAGTPKFSVGDASGSKLTFDGANLAITTGNVGIDADGVTIQQGDSISFASSTIFDCSIYASASGTLRFDTSAMSATLSNTYFDVTDLDGNSRIRCQAGYEVGTTKVIGTQGAAVADATGAGDVVAQLNTLLARLRAHGLIAT